jgi:hypothetical protein
LLAELNSAAKKVDPSMFGDTTLLPHEIALSSLDEIARIFGEAFAQEIIKLQPGRWGGPVQSSYGLHLVYVSERTEGRSSALAEVRELAEREWLSARREEATETSYRALRAKYAVVVQALERKSDGSSQPNNTANAAPIRR